MWFSYSGNQILRKQQRLLKGRIKAMLQKSRHRGERRPETTSLRDCMTAQEAAKYLRISTATVY
jgi:hypothetical protein